MGPGVGVTAGAVVVFVEVTVDLVHFLPAAAEKAGELKASRTTASYMYS